MKLLMLLSLLMAINACSASSKKEAEQKAFPSFQKTKNLEGKEIYQLLSGPIDFSKVVLTDDAKKVCLQQWNDLLVLQLPFFVKALKSYAPAFLGPDCLQFDAELYTVVNYRCWRRGVTKSCSQVLKRYRSVLVDYFLADLPLEKIPPQLVLHQIVTDFTKSYSDQVRQALLEKIRYVIDHQLATEDLVPLYLALYGKNKKIEPKEWQKFLKLLPQGEQKAILHLSLLAKNKKVAAPEVVQKAEEEFGTFNSNGEIDYFLAHYFYQKKSIEHSLKYLELALKKNDKSLRFKDTLSALKNNQKPIFTTQLSNPVFDYIESY